MCTSMEDMRDKAWLEGRAEGEISGRLKTLLSLVGSGLLTTAQAAKEAGVSESEFIEKIKQLGCAVQQKSKDM